MGIEPTSEAWEASILPLYDARSFHQPRLYPIQHLREKPAAQIPHFTKTQAKPRAAPTLIGQNSKVFIPALIEGSSSPNFCTSAASSISSTATPNAPSASHHRPVDQNLPRIKCLARITHMLHHQRPFLRRHVGAKCRPWRNQLEIKMLFAHRLAQLPVPRSIFAIQDKSRTANDREIIPHSPRNALSRISDPGPRANFLPAFPPC